MPEWFEDLDADALADVTAKGWNKPAGEIVSAIFNSHREAQKYIGSDPSMIVKLPKDAADPTYASIRDRVVGMGLPKDAAEYTFDDVKFKDGTPISPEDQAFIRELAVKYKMPLDAAREFAQATASRADAFAEAAGAGAASAKAANDAHLKGRWGMEYDQKALLAANGVDALKTLGVNVSLDGLAGDTYVAAMNGLGALGGQLKEHAILKGGGALHNPTDGMTSDQARVRFEDLRQNPEWASKALTPGTTEAGYLSDLQRIIARGNIQARQG